MKKVKNILVVGGAGYIGSHTTIALQEAGYGTVVYDDFSSGYRDAVFGDTLVEGRLDDTQKIIRTLQEHDIECVVHFAALIEAGQSVLTPLPFYQNNVAGTLCLLEAMQTSEVSRLVFSSTAAVYGNHTDDGLLHENLPRAPINPYGDSKAMIESILQNCVSAYGLQSIALRYFNACGADSKGRTGERHDPETHLIPLVIQAACGVRPDIKIYGTDYETPDGTCIRDYIHVTDLASGHVAAVKHLLSSDEPSFTALNLGTGAGLSVRQIVDAVKNVSSVDFVVQEADRRAGDPAVLVADASAAKAMLGWEASHSDIEQIVGDAWTYFQNNCSKA